MMNVDRDLMVMGGLLGAAGLLSLYLCCSDLKQADMVQVNDFPRTVGTWVSKDIPLSQKDLAVLETDNAFVRQYTNTRGDQVYLYIVYSQTNHKVSHPPEICYTGEGVSILENKSDSIPVSYKNMTISAHRLLLEANQLNQISFYWFKVGDSFTSSYWKQQLRLAWDELLGKKEGSALIRVSADVINKDQEKAVKEIKEFTDLITPQLVRFLP